MDIKHNQVIILQNTSSMLSTNDPKYQNPTIVITNEDDVWEKAINSWENGKNPTDSLEWSKGVFAVFKLGI